jgi:hypothetical protein
VVSSSFVTTSGSISSRTNIIETSYATTGSNTFTGPQYVSQASNAISFTSTASLYTDGGLRVAKDSYVSGTAYFNNITVYGTSSIQYITSSQVNIGSNVITVNTDTPAVRFGGLSVFDSGSTQLTGSLFWDSEKNHWIYSNPSGSAYNSAMLMNGPRNTGSLGTEQGTTNNALMKGQGGDHITSSQMVDDGTTVMIPGNLQVTGSLVGSSTAAFSGNLTLNSGGDRIFSINDTGGNLFQIQAASNILYYSARSTGGSLAFRTDGGNDVKLSIASTGLATFSNNLTLSSASSVLDVGGVLYVRGNGSAYATHDFNTGAANVAIYQQRNAAGTVINQFNAGGVSYVNGGDVGIGTVTPSSLATYRYLSINAASGGILDLKRNETSQLQISAESSGNYISGITNTPIYFYTNSALRLTIASTGAATFSSSVTAGGVISSEDIRIYRSASVTTGYINFGSTGTNYFGWGGSGFVFNGSATATSFIGEGGTTEIRLKGGGYGGSYNTSLRSIAGGIGVLQFGNNGDNFVLIGNTATSSNTFLSFRVNCTTESTTSGTEAFRITSTGAGNSSTEFYGAATFSSTISAGGTGGRSVVLTGAGSGQVAINGDNSTYATSIVFNNQAGGTTLTGIWAYGSGATLNWLGLGGTAYNSASIYLPPSGNVIIGSTTDYSQKLTVNGSYTRMHSIAEDNTNAGVFYQVKSGGTTVGQSSQLIDNAGNYIITTGTSSETERVRITSGGFFKASNTGNYYNAASYHELRANTSGNWVTYMTNTASTNPYGMIVEYTGASPNGTQNEFLYAYDTGGARFGVRSNGGIANYQANDVNLSDIRTKKDITPLESYWDKFKAIEIVKFKYKDQTHNDFNIGVIAQQVEEIAPEFVDIEGWDKKPKLDEDGNEIVSDEEPLKSIYTADLHHATIKVLQEAMTRIEEQQTQIEALKTEINELKNIVGNN